MVSAADPSLLHRCCPTIHSSAEGTGRGAERPEADGEGHREWEEGHREWEAGPRLTPDVSTSGQAPGWKISSDTETTGNSSVSSAPCPSGDPLDGSAQRRYTRPKLVKQATDILRGSSWQSWQWVLQLPGTFASVSLCHVAGARCSPAARSPARNPLPSSPRGLRTGHRAGLLVMGSALPLPDRLSLPPVTPQHECFKTATSAPQFLRALPETRLTPSLPAEAQKYETLRFGIPGRLVNVAETHDSAFPLRPHTR